MCVDMVFMHVYTQASKFCQLERTWKQKHCSSIEQIQCPDIDFWISFSTKKSQWSLEKVLTPELQLGAPNMQLFEKDSGEHIKAHRGQGERRLTQTM